MLELNSYKGHFKQRSNDQKLGDQFKTNWTLNWTLLHIKKYTFFKGTMKQIEPWIGPFFTLKNAFFSMVQWMCVKTWCSIGGSNIENVPFTCQTIRLICDFFLFFFIFFPFLFKLWKCTFFDNHLVRIHKINHVNSKIGQN